MSLISFMQRFLDALRRPLIQMSLYGLADAVAKLLFRPYQSATAMYSATPTVDVEVAVDVSSIVSNQAVAVVFSFDYTSGATPTVLTIYSATGEGEPARQHNMGGAPANSRATGIMIIALDSAKKFYFKESGAGVATSFKWLGWFEYGPIKQPLNISQF